MTPNVTIKVSPRGNKAVLTVEVEESKATHVYNSVIVDCGVEFDKEITLQMGPFSLADPVYLNNEIAKESFAEELGNLELFGHKIHPGASYFTLTPQAAIKVVYLDGHSQCIGFLPYRDPGKRILTPTDFTRVVVPLYKILNTPKDQRQQLLFDLIFQDLHGHS